PSVSQDKQQLQPGELTFLEEGGQELCGAVFETGRVSPVFGSKTFETPLIVGAPNPRPRSCAKPALNARIGGAPIRTVFLLCMGVLVFVAMSLKGPIELPYIQGVFTYLGFGSEGAPLELGRHNRLFERRLRTGHASAIN